MQHLMWILEAKVQWTKAVLKERIFFWVLIAFSSTMLEVDEEVMQNSCCESVTFKIRGFKNKSAFCVRSCSRT
jgi:hypothetical protein